MILENIIREALAFPSEQQRKIDQARQARQALKLRYDDARRRGDTRGMYEVDLALVKATADLLRIGG
jgi:hypothetical protein